MGRAADVLNGVCPLSMTRSAFERAAEASGYRPTAAGDAYTGFWRDGEPAGLVPEPTRTERSGSDHGEVRKFLLPLSPSEWGGRPARLATGVPPSASTEAQTPPLETESVIIPMRKHELNHTLCLSSQVGCAMGCEFCETAQMGLIRNLTAGEITAQYWAALHHFGTRCRNVVFMGMGEPLDNAEAVIGAIEVLTDHLGAGVGMRRIQISTVGRIDGLELLRERVLRPGWRQLNLAVSINAPNDEIRSAIMPINRAMPLGDLIPILEGWPLRKGGGAINCEYVLIPGVNDADAHADELAVLLRAVRCCVNVIPYNPRRDSPWPAPAESSVERFLRRLIAAGQFATRRRTKGRDTMAACGQLGNEQIRKRRFVGVSIGDMPGNTGPG